MIHGSQSLVVSTLKYVFYIINDIISKSKTTCFTFVKTIFSMRSDSSFESKTSCFTYKGIILWFANPYPILVCQYNLHHTGISVSKRRNRK